MANRDNPHGFIIRYSPTGEVRGEPVILAAANAIIGFGDLLAQTSSGTYDRWASGAVAGVAMQEAAASSGATILACLDPNIVLSAQTDNGTGTLTSQTGVNLNATVVVGAATNGISRMEIDESSGNTTADLPLKIVGLDPMVGNAFGEFNQLLCIINNHVRKGGTGTAGI